jgi:L-alanine-DL-glutamate epimerase-like enolase superfamily enzyme
MLAESFGIGIMSHLETQVGAALAAGVSNGLCVEVMQPDRDPLYHSLVMNRPKIQDGRMTLSDLPGWGLELDTALIKKIRVN